MDNIQTVDFMIAIKELKKNAEKAKAEAIERLNEADGVLSSVKFLEDQFSTQIESYHESRKV